MLICDACYPASVCEATFVVGGPADQVTTCDDHLTQAIKTQTAAGKSRVVQVLSRYQYTQPPDRSQS